MASEIDMAVSVTKAHFLKAAREIGQNGDNDVLPYDIESSFIRDKADDLADICFSLFNIVERKAKKDAAAFINGLTIKSERLLAPAGSHGFRIVNKIHPFWNLYLNGIGLALAEENEKRRSHRAHSYRLSSDSVAFFDRTKSWRAYKEATLSEPLLDVENSIVIQTDISSFYEHIYHHRLENVIAEILSPGSRIATQVDRMLSKMAAGRSFGLPIGGQCARILAEIMMTPIDISLSDSGLVWHRYVDDFTLICSSQKEAYTALSTLSHSLADYGLTLNRSKTTTLSARHYREYVHAQLGDGDEPSAPLREIDLHFDPYSDHAATDYEQLKKSFVDIDVQFLLDLEKDKSEPDSFVMAQIGRALKFQELNVAKQLCATLLDVKNIYSFRASWSKIMRGVYAVRSGSQFASIHDYIDDLLDIYPGQVGHLLVPESNLLHYLRVLRFRRTDIRGQFVRGVYNGTSSSAVRRACIDCWHHWRDRASFQRLRNQWESLGADEQRMLWLAAGNFGDDGAHARSQIKRTLNQIWRLGFEVGGGPTFASSYEDWVNENA